MKLYNRYIFMPNLDLSKSFLDATYLAFRWLFREKGCEFPVPQRGWPMFGPYGSGVERSSLAQWHGSLL